MNGLAIGSFCSSPGIRLFCLLLVCSASLNTAKCRHVSSTTTNPTFVLPENIYFIESKQRTRVEPDEQFSELTNTWLVRDYFSFNTGKGASISYHENVNTGEQYKLVAIQGRFYYVTSSAGSEDDANQQLVCKLDHRHDHTTLFPWRRTGQLSSRWTFQTKADPLKGSHIAGLGAVWLNMALDFRTKCRIESRGGDTDKQPVTMMICASESTSKALRYELSFSQPAAEERQGSQFVLDESRLIDQLSHLKTARVYRKHTIHSDQASLLQEVIVDAHISSVALIKRHELAPNLASEFEQLTRLCKESASNSDWFAFPSLMRHIALSDQRNYYFAYSISSYEPLAGQLDLSTGGGGTRRRLVSRQNVQEWFSYDRQMQTFVRSYEPIIASGTSGAKDSPVGPTIGPFYSDQFAAEKYLRVLNIIPGHSVNYQIDLLNRQSIACNFGSLDQDTALAAGSRLLRRALTLISESTGSRVHHGELIGLGALLMNVADIHHKRELPGDEQQQEREHRVELADEYKYMPLVQWTVDDFWNCSETGRRRWSLFFKKPTSLTKPGDFELSISDLVRIELHQRVQTSRNMQAAATTLGGLEDGQLLEANGNEYSYALIMEIAITDSSSHLYGDEIDRAFTIPSLCPEATDLESFDAEEEQEPVKDDEPANVLPLQEEEEQVNFGDDDDNEAFDNNQFEFPSFEEHFLGFEQNYKLSSLWTLVDEDEDFSASGAPLKRPEQMRVVEYYALLKHPLSGKDKHDDDNIVSSLFSRLDIAPINPYGDDSEWSPDLGPPISFYLFHSINVLIRCNEAFDVRECCQVDKLDPWLEPISATVRAQFDSIPWSSSSSPPGNLRHLGVGGLWSLASASANLELVSVSTEEDNYKEKADQKGQKRRKFEAWLLEGDLEAELIGGQATSILFNFSYRSYPKEDNSNALGPVQLLHKFELDSLTVKSEVAFKQATVPEARRNVNAIKISDIKLEPGKAQQDDFKLSDSLIDTSDYSVSKLDLFTLNLNVQQVPNINNNNNNGADGGDAERKERARNFVTIGQQFGDPSGTGDNDGANFRKLNFKIAYELIIDSSALRQAERRLQVEEWSSPRLGQGLVVFKMDRAHTETLKYWSIDETDVNDYQLFEQVDEQNCKLAPPSLIELFDLDEYIDLMGGGGPRRSDAKASSIVANLWQLFAKRVLKSPLSSQTGKDGQSDRLPGTLTTSAVPTKRHGKRVELIKWSLYNELNTVVMFEFVRSLPFAANESHGAGAGAGDGDDIRLDSILLTPHSTTTKPRLRFAIGQMNKLEVDDEHKMELTPACEFKLSKLKALRHDNESMAVGALFPRLDAQLATSRLHMRSELAMIEDEMEGEAAGAVGAVGAAAAGSDSLGLYASKRRWVSYLVDEWYEPNCGYRSKLTKLDESLRREWSANNGAPEHVSGDYLMNLTTGEYFNLSEPGKCWTLIGEPEVANEQAAGVVERTSPLDELRLTGNSEIARKLFLTSSCNSAAFYGPISMWLLAGHLNAELDHNSVGGNSLGLLDLFELARLNEWFSKEVWLVKHPSDEQLQYRLTFGGFPHSTLLERVDSISWHQQHLAEPEVVSSSTPTQKPAKPRLLKTVTAEVVNYCNGVGGCQGQMSWDELFRIPKGRGCKRSEAAKKLVKTHDIVVFEKLSPLEFEYEATLSATSVADSAIDQNGKQSSTETARNSNRVPTLTPRPLINTGWFGRCPSTWSLQRIGLLRVNHQQQHHIGSGAVTSFTRVVSREKDSSDVLVRRHDELTGACSISKFDDTVPDDIGQAGGGGGGGTDSELLTLNFGDETVHLFGQLFSSYEPGPKMFDLIQEYDSEQVDSNHLTSRTFVYESWRPNIWLNSRLQGPGSIVKTFTRFNDTQSRSTYYFHYHSSFLVELIIPNVAHLSLHVNNLRFRECSDIIRLARAEECHADSEHYDTAPGSWAPWASPSSLLSSLLDNGHSDKLYHRTPKLRQRLRSFQLVFVPQDDWRISPELFESMKSKLETWFLELLLNQSLKLPVMQVGKFRLTFRHHDSTLWAHFNLLEPVALLHSFRNIPDRSLRPRPRQSQGSLSGLTGVTRKTSSLLKCSDMCELQRLTRADQKLCVAFSYCHSERLCTALLASSLTGSSPEVNETSANETRATVVVGLEDFVTNTLEPNMEPEEEDSSCSVYHSGDLAELTERVYVDDVKDFIQSHVSSEKAWSNMFSLYVKTNELTHPQLGVVQVHFLAKQLIELTKSRQIATLAESGSGQQTEQDDGNDQEPGEVDYLSEVAIVISNIADHFILVSSQSDLHLSEDELLKGAANGDSGEDALQLQLSQAADLQECLFDCFNDEHCLVSSYCSTTLICKHARGVTNWAKWRHLFESSRKQIVATEPLISTTSCSIYARNMLLDYEKYAKTREPESYATKASGLSLIECAAYCELSDEQANIFSAKSTLQLDCLSFDYCLPPPPIDTTSSSSDGSDNSMESVCYLQHLHIVMDSFDESVLKQTGSAQARRHLNNSGDSPLEAPETSTSLAQCSHYSRSLLADFNLERGKRFATHETISNSGMQLDVCALVCRRTEDCQAFEYCNPSLVKQTSTLAVPSCYLKRPVHPVEIWNPAKDKTSASESAAAAAAAKSTSSSSQPLNLDTVDSDECNIFTLKQNLPPAWEDNILAAAGSPPLDGQRWPEQQQSTTTSSESRELCVTETTSMLKPIVLLLSLVLGTLVSVAYLKITKKRRK